MFLFKKNDLIFFKCITGLLIIKYLPNYSDNYNEF